MPADPVPGLNLPDLPCDQLDSLQQCAQRLLAAGPDPTKLAKAVKACGNKLPTVCRSVTAGTPLAQICSLADNLPTAPPTPKGPKLPSLSQLQNCLRAGKPLGPACDKIDPRVIAARCARTSSPHKPKGYDSETCKRYRELTSACSRVARSARCLSSVTAAAAPVAVTAACSAASGEACWVARTAPASGRPHATSTRTVATTGVRSDLGALLVWGMVQR